MRGSLNVKLSLATAGVLLAVAGWKWLDASASRPDRIPGGPPGVPSAILLAQAWDCPDRTAAMARWVSGRSAATPGADLPLSIGFVSEEPSHLDPTLRDLPRLDRAGVERAARAVLRSGIPGTPALILLDGDGHVLLADTFAPTGPGSRLTLAAKLLTSTLPAASPETSTHSDGA